MKNKYSFLLLGIFALFSSFLTAQTVLIDPAGDGGFESGATFAANGWTVVNAGGGNRSWYVGTGQAGFTGARAAFIGNDATTVGTATQARTVHFYRSITIPANAENITLTFKYKQEVADPGNDYIAVYTSGAAPTNGNLPAGSLHFGPFPAVSVPTFTEQTVVLDDSLAGTTTNLIFTFRADNNAPHAYGAVDDIELTYELPTCPRPTNLAVSDVTTTTAVLNWDAGDSETLWDVYYGATPLTAPDELTTPSVSGVGVDSLLLTGLSFSTNYEVYVRADCGSGDFSSWFGPASFTTLTPPADLTDVSATSTNICEGESVTLTATGEVGTVQWFDDACGGNQIGTGTTLIVSPTDTTTYYARNFDNGEPSINCLSVTVNVTPVFALAISANGSLEFCDGEDVKLTVNTSFHQYEEFVVWDFNDETLTPQVGSGTITNIGLANITYVTGAGSSDPAGTNRAINFTPFPAQGTNPKTTGAEIHVSTVGYEDIEFAFDIRASNTGANTIAIQYNLDVTDAGSSWVDAQTFVLTAGAVWFNDVAVDFSGVVGANNNPNFGVRLVSDFDADAGEYVAANNGSNYGTAGTWRFDMLIFSGSTIVDLDILWSTGDTTKSIIATQSGVYSVEVDYDGFCSTADSVVVTVNPVYSDSLTTSICQGDSFELVDGSFVSVADFYTVTVSSALGCDSTVTVELLVNPIYNDSLSATICQGDSFELADGSFVDTTNFYTVTVLSALGCDSTVTVNLTVNPVYFTILNESICQGDSFELADGTFVSIADTYVTVVQSVNNCDSTVTVNLDVLPVYTVTLDESVCQGDSFELADGTYVSIADTYTVVLQSANNCDSTVVVNLTINPIYNDSIDVQICSGSDYELIDGSVVDTAGFYTATVASALGCDSTVTVNLSIVSEFFTTLNESICFGDSFELANGTFVDTANTYVVTVPSSIGCDSTITVNLTINPVFNHTFNESICFGDSFELADGTFVDAAGPYTVSVLSSFGCDSTVTVNLSINPVYSSSSNESICEGDTYELADGTLVDSTDTYVVMLQSVEGCDSTITVNLTVNPVYSFTFNESICQGDSFELADGTFVDVADVYVVVLQSTESCDSTITVNLTVNPVYSTVLDVELCVGNTYQLADGTVVDTADTYIVTVPSVNSCDSTVTVNLSYISEFFTTVNASICEGDEYELPDGVMVDSTDTYVVTILSTGGCDSIITVNLVVNEVYTTNLSATICEGDSFELADGTFVGVADIYSVTVPSATNCDSTVVVNLSVNPIYNTSVSASICAGESYELPDGTMVTAANTYVVTLTSVNLCDSVVTVALTVNPLPTVNLGADVQTELSSYTLDAGSGFASYDWSTGATTQTITVTESDSYSVTVTDNNSCSNTSSVNVDFVINSISNIKLANFNMYPVPANNMLNIQFSTNEPKVNVVVVNAIGNKLFTNDYNVTNGRFANQIDVRNFAEGVYFIQITQNAELTIIPFVVTR